MLVPVHRRPPSWQRSFGRARRRYEALVVHPDGERLIAAEHDGSVTVWNLADGTEHRHLATMLSAYELQEARSVQLELHPDGVRLFSTVSIVDGGDITHAWNLATGHLIDRHENPYVYGRFLGDHEMLTTSGRYLTVWNFETGQAIRRIGRDDSWWRVLGLIDDHAVLRGRVTLELWNVRSGAMRWAMPLAECRAAAIAGDLVVVAAPGQLTFRAVDGTEVRRIEVPELVDNGLDWKLEVGGDTAVLQHTTSELVAIDLRTGTTRSRFVQPSLAEVVVVPTGEEAIVWSPLERTASLWSVATGVCKLRAPMELVASVDGARAFGIDGPQVREWAVAGHHDATLPAWIELAVATVPDVLIARDRAGTVHVVDHAGVSRHTWSPAPAGTFGGARVAHVEGATVVITDATTGTRAYAIDRPLGALALSSDGSLLAGTFKGETSVWRLGDHAAVQLSAMHARKPSVEVIAMAASRIALAYDNRVELWRIDPPLRLHTFVSITPAACAAFDPALRWLVTGHDDGALLVRDIVERKHHATIETGERPISWLAIHGDLAAVCVDRALEIWDLGTGAKLEAWEEEPVYDVAWLDDETLACATDGGLVLLRRTG